MQKNTTTLSIAVILSIIGVASISLATFGFGQNSEIEIQEKTLQEIHGAMPNYTVEELASGTKYAIIGQVKQINPVFVETNRMPKTVFSDVVIQVNGDLNNQYDEKEITVRIQGGTIDDFQTISYLSANFKKNENVLFFVPEKDLDSIWGDNYYVAGGFMGKYTLEHGKAIRDQIHDSVDEVELVSKIYEARGL